MSSKDRSPLNNLLCFALYSTSRAMTQLYRSYLDESDLTYPQFLVLFLLWKEDGCTVREISDTLFLDSGTVTPLLQRLESKRLLRRVRSSDDERVVNVFLTDDGRALEAKILPAIGAGMACDLGTTSAKEVADLISKVHALRTAIVEAVERNSGDK